MMAEGVVELMMAELAKEHQLLHHEPEPHLLTKVRASNSLLSNRQRAATFGSCSYCSSVTKQQAALTWRAATKAAPGAPEARRARAVHARARGAVPGAEWGAAHGAAWSAAAPSRSAPSPARRRAPTKWPRSRPRPHRRAAGKTAHHPKGRAT